MALCVTLLFLGGKHSQASENVSEKTNHWIWPADGMVTDMFGTRRGNHKGIDIAAPLGTPIYSVDAGIVTKSYYSNSYGHVIFVKHNNNIETVYAHLKARFVNSGDTISAGQQVGEMGSTGDSSGVHLHFEVHLNEWTIDKRNAINPVLALGDVKIGQEVVVAKVQPQPDSGVLEAIAKTRLYEGHGKTYKEEEQESVVLGAERGESARTHTVQQGETIWSISKDYNVSIEDIVSKNHLQDEKIVVNQTLTIEGSPSKYIVQQGDTLEGIAKKTGTSVDRLKQLNQLSSDKITPLQELLIE